MLDNRLSDNLWRRPRPNWPGNSACLHSANLDAGCWRKLGTVDETKERAELTIKSSCERNNLIEVVAIPLATEVFVLDVGDGESVSENNIRVH
ncbi:hypothetical protein D3C87_1858620 [compost metagenome]